MCYWPSRDWPWWRLTHLAIWFPSWIHVPSTQASQPSGYPHVVPSRTICTTHLKENKTQHAPNRVDKKQQFPTTITSVMSAVYQKLFCNTQSYLNVMSRAIIVETDWYHEALVNSTHILCVFFFYNSTRWHCECKAKMSTFQITKLNFNIISIMCAQTGFCELIINVFHGFTAVRSNSPVPNH